MSSVISPYFVWCLHSCFFTDDKIENCDAAAKLGINAHHFTTAEDLYEQWSKYF